VIKWVSSSYSKKKAWSTQSYFNVHIFYIYMYIYLCIWVYTYMGGYRYTNTHTHTHTQMYINTYLHDWTKKITWNSLTEKTPLVIYSVNYVTYQVVALVYLPRDYPSISTCENNYNFISTNAKHPKANKGWNLIQFWLPFLQFAKSWFNWCPTPWQLSFGLKVIRLQLSANEALSVWKQLELLQHIQVKIQQISSKIKLV
jgi:hypothetical protein